MKRLLARANIGELSQLAATHVLLGFDYDGTLAPIVADREHAVMRERTILLFRRICELYPSAVISGRARPDVHARQGEANVKYIVGNHGLEPGLGLAEFENEIVTALPILAAALSEERGVEIENKRYSLAIHYRNSRHKRPARERILRAASALTPAMRVVPGKLVLNLVPERATHKGNALLELRALESASATLFVGDDVTDEDVFRVFEPGRLLGIRIGHSKRSLATHFLHDQGEIDQLLETLIALRCRT